MSDRDRSLSSLLMAIYIPLELVQLYLNHQILNSESKYILIDLYAREVCLRQKLAKICPVVSCYACNPMKIYKLFIQPEVNQLFRLIDYKGKFVCVDTCIRKFETMYEEEVLNRFLIIIFSLLLSMGAFTRSDISHLLPVINVESDTALPHCF